MTGGDQPESSLLATNAGSEGRVGGVLVFLCRNNSGVRVRRSLQTRRSSISDSAEKTKEKTGGEAFSPPPLLSDGQAAVSSCTDGVFFSFLVFKWPIRRGTAIL